jgi:O-succinylbenzoic acid--CoA ligase
MNLDDDFAIVHTSGTSGRPKAAMLTCRNIVSSALASARKLEHRQRERWLCALPLYHLGGLSILLRSLIYGTAFDLMPAAPFDVHRLNQKLSDHPITLVSLVPTMLQRLLDARTRPWNPQLRLILLGGEAPSPQLLERCIAEKLPIATSYGLTETASQVATALPDLVYRKPGAAGKPLLFSTVRIIDEQGNDAPPNVHGEVLVSGETVMRGYYNDPAATAKALRAGWLHTGDIGYLDEDGDLFILQRRVDLIVSGGENIYPAEVEAALRRHPAVAEVLVLGLPDPKWGQRVAAVIETRAGQSPSAANISNFARERLAAYKVPRRIAFVEALPRTASGKLRRREARKVFDDAPASDS